MYQTVNIEFQILDIEYQMMHIKSCTLKIEYQMSNVEWHKPGGQDETHWSPAVHSWLRQWLPLKPWRRGMEVFLYDPRREPLLIMTITLWSNLCLWWWWRPPRKRLFCPLSIKSSISLSCPFANLYSTRYVHLSIMNVASFVCLKK